MIFASMERVSQLKQRAFMHALITSNKIKYEHISAFLDIPIANLKALYDGKYTLDEVSSLKLTALVALYLCS